jgi:hypothetical protein
VCEIDLETAVYDLAIMADESCPCRVLKMFREKTDFCPIEEVI